MHRCGGVFRRQWSPGNPWFEHVGKALVLQMCTAGAILGLGALLVPPEHSITMARFTVLDGNVDQRFWREDGLAHVRASWGGACRERAVK